MVTHAKKATVGNSQKKHPGKIYSSSKCVRKLIFCIFCARARSGRVPDRFRRLRRPSRIRNFQEFYDTFLLVFAILFCGLRADFVRVCRVPPGCCRDPHPDAVIHSPFSPGVRRCAQRFKFAVPQRGAGRVETTKLVLGKCRPGRFTLPYLPAGRPRIAVPYRDTEGNFRNTQA